MAYPKVLAFILAGGKGERLFPLTAFRSKPSVPIGGRYRIVDFVLSNLVNSQIYSLYLLVQYRSQSLIEHVRMHWNLSSVVKDHFVAVVPPQMRMGPEWFQGTADAVFQNVNLIQQHNPELVIIFGA
ncbi:MAG: glgC, partial [Nitrospirae bacterium]|nr:glgC [Nitrospirota bacterium]